MAKDKWPQQKDILEVMRTTGCDRRTARRALVSSLREMRAAEALLLNALRKGQVKARGVNPETGRWENIPRDYWSSVS